MNLVATNIDKLFQVLGDGNSTVHTAFEIWSRIEGFGEAIVPELNAAIASQNEDIAKLCFMVLREGATFQSEIDLAPFIPPAVIALQHKNNLVKLSAMSFLKAMKGRADSAIPELLKIIATDDEYLAANAISAILQIDPNQIDALAPRIKVLLESDELEVKRIVLETLGGLGEPAM